MNSPNGRCWLAKWIWWFLMLWHCTIVYLSRPEESYLGLQSACYTLFEFSQLYFFQSEQTEQAWLLPRLDTRYLQIFKVMCPYFIILRIKNGYSCSRSNTVGDVDGIRLHVILRHYEPSLILFEIRPVNLRIGFYQTQQFCSIKRRWLLYIW